MRRRSRAPAGVARRDGIAAPTQPVHAATPVFRVGAARR
jgi:hypothetical protein